MPTCCSPPTRSSQKTFRPLETFTVVALIYFVVIFAGEPARAPARAAAGAQRRERRCTDARTGTSPRSSPTPTRCWSARVGTLRIFAICLVLGLSLGLVVGLGRYARSARGSTGRRRRSSSSSATRRCWCRSCGSTSPCRSCCRSRSARWRRPSLGISLNSAAFSAEIYRGGIQSIEPRPVGRRAGARHELGRRRCGASSCRRR